MKRLLLVFLVLFFASSAFAQIHIIDDFEDGDLGHFQGSRPKFSGSTTGILDDLVALDSTAAYTGAASLKFTLRDDPALTTAWFVRFISGPPLANLAANDTLTADGWIGFAIKATGGSDSVWCGIGVDAPNTAHISDSSKLILDGQWHIYQWDLDDTTQWRRWVAAVGNPSNPTSIDALWFWAPNGTPDIQANLDYVVWNSTGYVPVEIVSFKADVTDNNVELRWITATELNNSGYEIERRAEGDSKFKKIGFVQGKGTATQSSIYTYQDAVTKMGAYSYRLKQVDFDGTFEYSNTIEVVVNAIPGEYTLAQNYPNPFNPATSITYNIPENGYVNLTVFNLLGEKVAELVNTMQEAGTHTVNFNASSLASGTYIYSLNVNGNSITKKMSLIK
ncbi:MAG: hypothetical protein AUK34_05480 [Ignavibacteria bacterium CG2_30_36_16]|nr:T9SS type A sorting domain-containing protein [Ignavibacteria bacterium]OIP61043.1 MAG: hypothetical protein AUK34_05480 [Ignavibacteria bacterium CG2_30_36_16]PJB01555.1 MAG: hypothetical protein CO127_03240 [Ignavibacteria bacterium CG_4_9_14_3_um_filter_36_18]